MDGLHPFLTDPVAITHHSECINLREAAKGPRQPWHSNVLPYHSDDIFKKEKLFSFLPAARNCDPYERNELGLFDNGSKNSDQLPMPLNRLVHGAPCSKAL